MAFPSSSSIRVATAQIAESAPTPLVLGLLAREAWAERQFVERYTLLVERVLLRILGSARDLDDLTQEALLRVLTRLPDLREPEALPGFVAQITTFVAREAIRARQRKRWLSFFAPSEAPEICDEHVAPEARAAVRALYRIVGSLDAEEQIVFTLRALDELPLAEIAEMTGTSLATVKRRLSRAESKVSARARVDEDLAPFVESASEDPS